MKPLIQELETLLNGYSEENESNTPDFILAKFMLACLEQFNVATRERDRWYGVHLEPGNKYFKKAEATAVCVHARRHAVEGGTEMTPAGQRWTKRKEA